MEQNKPKISRKKFLEICGSAIAGGSIIGVSAFLVHRNLTSPEKGFTGSPDFFSGDAFLSPYKPIASFTVPGSIESLELYGENLIVATSSQLYIYDQEGELQNRFTIGNNLRDMAVEGDEIYLLFPSRIEVYNRDGSRVREWEACSDESDYCSMTIAPGTVFVTDAFNKNICKYTAEGSFVRFIQSPEGFIIPSYTFGIVYVDGLIYCSNSGRHKIEKYSVDGDYVGSFGKAGGAAGMFCGCCNPVHLAYTPTGEIITSEKGNPRISCYGADGEFRSVLLDSKTLGGGNKAYDVKVMGDKLFITGKNKVSVFQYDAVTAARTACSSCKGNCPLRKSFGA